MLICSQTSTFKISKWNRDILIWVYLWPQSSRKLSDIHYFFPVAPIFDSPFQKLIGSEDPSGSRVHTRRGKPQLGPETHLWRSPCWETARQPRYISGRWVPRHVKASRTPDNDAYQSGSPRLDPAVGWKPAYLRLQQHHVWWAPVHAR